jgi:hypothetical protein
MNGNDARIVRLFTARTDAVVEDNTPNASSPITPRFDLILQASATAVPTTR